ncbi:MAG: HD domain-containing protein [Clostridia bacterium]|nr:HD domain-containing protein [Clostridia bacterium]
MIGFTDIKNDPTVRTYIQKGNAVLGVIGFTEHGFAHAEITANMASGILTALGYDPRTIELARIAGYLHDIGNCVNRKDHAQSGALMAFTLLTRLGMSAEEVSDIIGAIGHHDESTAAAVSPISAALILADKSDVRRSRVRSKSTIGIDIHDRVNYAVIEPQLLVVPETREVHLKLTIDTEISAVMDYFEIFLSRMLLCRKAAEYLGLRFRLDMNGTQLL